MGDRTISIDKIIMEQKTVYKNCQSCGIPLHRDKKGGGTEKDGTKSRKYCGFCYEDGKFNSGNVTLKEFTEVSRKGMINGGHNKFFAWLFSRPFLLRNLERWKVKK